LTTRLIPKGNFTLLRESFQKCVDGPSGIPDTLICVTLSDVEQARNRTLFDLIKNKEHWKQAIDAVIPFDSLAEFDRAATYFHGRGLSVQVIDNKLVHVTSAGYNCW